MKRIMRVFVQDSPARGLRGRDEILHAIPPGKILVLGTLWTGELAPRIDALVETLTNSYVAPGLSVGGTLHAEEIPHVLDLGHQWIGDLEARIAVAGRPKGAGPQPQVDVGEVLTSLERLRGEMNSDDPLAVADGVRRLRGAADRAGGREEEEPHGRRIADGLMPRHMVGDFSKPVPIATINQRNRQFHDRHRVSPHLDSSGRLRRTDDARPTGDTARQTALRDAIHAQSQAKTPADRLRAMNDCARAFWPSTGESPAEPPLGRLVAPIAGTATEINQRNRAFWGT